VQRVDFSSVKERAFVDLVRWAPKGTYSRLIGYLADRKLPRPLRAAVYTAFARRVGANLEEVERPLADYPTLGAFFTRKLRPGLRPIQRDTGAIVSPCDGTVAECGTVRAGQLLQAKGQHYPLFGLLCDRAGAARFERGTYVTIYLAPRDYHRVHFAVEGQVTGFQHVPGALFPVNAAAAKHVGALYTRNERLITYQDSPAGEVATVMVGATAVGRISVTYDAVQTHARAKGRPGPRVRFATPRAVGRGDELGTFHLGSTVVMLFEPGRVQLEDLQAGKVLRLGEIIAREAAAEARGGAAA
jgi:phosphatidylserine decarboxylase